MIVPSIADSRPVRERAMTIAQNLDECLVFELSSFASSCNITAGSGDIEVLAFAVTVNIVSALFVGDPDELRVGGDILRC